jgi:hypothetical protein
MLEPPSKVPAIEDVMRKTPPCALVRKAGCAAFSRKVCALTFTAKQVSQSETVGALRSLKEVKRVYPWARGETLSNYTVEMLKVEGGRGEDG